MSCSQQCRSTEEENTLVNTLTMPYPHRANYSDAAVLFTDSDMIVFLALILFYYVVSGQGAHFSKCF